MSDVNGNGMSRRQWLKTLGVTAFGASALGAVLSSCAREEGSTMSMRVNRRPADNEPFDADAIIGALPGEVNCVGCGRCMPCRFGVNIPAMYAAWNEAVKSGDIPSSGDDYRNGGGADRARAFVARIENDLGDKHLAHRCALCGACIRECPMHLPIAKHMRCIGKFIDLSRETM